jgi:hypothetical protein
VASAENKVAELETGKAELGKEIAKAKEEGRRTLIAQIQGSILAIQGQPPELVAISDDNGVIALIGKYAGAKPSVGAWYSVNTVATNNLKGVVEIVHIDLTRGLVWMHCVEPTAREFWQHLTDRVSYDDSPPANVALVNYQVELGLVTKDATTSNISKVDQ